MNCYINFKYIYVFLTSSFFILLFNKSSFAEDHDYIETFYGRYYECSVQVKEYQWFAKIMNIFGEVNKTWGVFEVKYKIGGFTEDPIELESKWLDGFDLDLDEHRFRCAEGRTADFECTYKEGYPAFKGDSVDISLNAGTSDAKRMACQRLLKNWENQMGFVDVINIKRANYY